MDYMRNSQCGRRMNMGSYRMNAGYNGMADSKSSIPEPYRMPACDNDGYNCNNKMAGSCMADSSDSDNWVIGMAYVPWQTWSEDKVFDLEQGLAHGSIFKELVLPFDFAGPGCRKRGGCR